MMMTSQVSCQGHGQPSVISVSSSLPLGTPPVPIRALWELFNGCARFGNQTWRRSEYSDKRRRTVNDVDGAVVFIARTMPCHRTRASFTHLSKIQIHETNTKYKFERRNSLPILKLITKLRKQHVEHYVSMEYTMYQNTKGLI